jgi:hypothetical protein
LDEDAYWDFLVVWVDIAVDGGVAVAWRSSAGAWAAIALFLSFAIAARLSLYPTGWTGDRAAAGQVNRHPALPRRYRGTRIVKMS